MNWGKKITILYLSFAVMILTLVFLCYGQKIELESKNYYTEELNYQNKIDAINNSNQLKQSIEHLVDKNQVSLFIPAEFLNSDLQGEICFFRPSDSSKDIKLKMNFDQNGTQLISSDKLQKGIYKMQLSWIYKGKSYYKENVITIK